MVLKVRISVLLKKSFAAIFGMDFAAIASFGYQ